MAIFSWFRTILDGIATVLFRCVLQCFRLVFFMSPPPQKQINPPMATSSSSSVHSTPLPSSSGSWKHDVFLSFRGTDTRNNFVDHLYSVLVQQGIYVYKDDQTLPRGETIGPALFKAIEESQIALIIFSENYADSSWCLQELEHIMRCKDENGLIVLPIFYHIDPSELRKQKGMYGAALAKHEFENKNVESWRKALVDAGNLSGDVANGPETVVIKQIVGTISNRLWAPIPSDDVDLIGIEARLQELKSKMEMASDGVVMVGIWGVGGGGKTTLASALYDEISTRFEGSCFVKDVREESRKHGLPKLQKDILSIVLKLKTKEVVEDVGRLIKSRFRRKKVLMVLDDVDHADQLKELAGSNAWFGKGSRIIITTRDNHLLNAHKVNVIYNISLLNDDEGIKLFYKHAPRDDRAIEDYEMVSKDVVSYAGGLPLAIKVLGSFLCDKDMSEWRSALARLKDVPDTDIIEKLMISYDGLKPMEKELFLDIACFFKKRFKDEAMVIFDACDYHPIIGIKVLIQKALITVSEEGMFDMHDLVQEMGHYIVRGENPKNPELHSRIWQKEDIVKICRLDAMKENHMIKALQGSFNWAQEAPPSLPQVVVNMKKLRWISRSYHPATPLPSEFQPMELCYLQLNRSFVEQLWEGYKHLPNLKVFDLSGSLKLVSTPDFGGLPCLERLILSGCRSLKEIHPSIGYHQRLIFLNMENCSSLKMFPPIIRMKKLETLLLYGCKQLCKFPDIQTSMDNLIKLKLSATGILILPSSVGQHCTNLVSLDLRNCRYLHSIEGNFRVLKYLKVLYLKGCSELKNIPTEGLFDVECCLELLSLSCTSFTNFYRGAVNIGVPRFLTRLSLRDCSLVDGDITSAYCEELSNLEVLDLSKNKFSQLHSSLLQLHHLKFLKLSECKNLVKLPDLPSSIAVLVAVGCDSLEIVGDFPKNLKWLWKVYLSSSKYCNADKLLRSMLQGNAIEYYFISIVFKECNVPTRSVARETFTLQLPWNWYSEFSGFLVSVAKPYSWFEEKIIIEDETGRENEDVLEASDEESRTFGVMSSCYISFGSLRNTSWWNSTHTTISFSIGAVYPLKVELVPRRSQGDDGSIESTKDTRYRSNFWDEEHPNLKTFEIISDSKSSIRIKWRTDLHEDMFNDVI